jgi:hypothetical protein
VSLPFGWFTDAEKTLVLMIVTELGLNWEEFVESVRDGSVSYYAKASETSLRDTGIPVLPLQDIVKECLRRHLAEFGKVNFPI